MASRTAKLSFDVVIPALNEVESIEKVITAVPKETKSGRLKRLVVADNGSDDGTAVVARNAGAVVVREEEPGYGAACLRALAFLGSDPAEVVVFLDGDFSDDPTEVERLLAPIFAGADMVIGSRVRGTLEKGALTTVQRVGNAIACTGLRHCYQVHYTDLGPFRAIRTEALQRLALQDRNWGWTVEMQIRAAQEGLRSVEVPVSYRRRHAGKSKVSGTIKGSIAAGTKILWLLATSGSAAAASKSTRTAN